MRTHGWIVMLRHQKGFPLPLVDDDMGDDRPKLFETEREAEMGAEENPLGEAFGFEIYEW